MWPKNSDIFRIQLHLKNYPSFPNTFLKHIFPRYLSSKTKIFIVDTKNTLPTPNCVPEPNWAFMNHNFLS